jgi:hypothetical protein
MSFTMSVALVQVTDTHATFGVTRSPDLGTNKMVLAGMMATVLAAEQGGEYREWMRRLAPTATTEGSEWKDRVVVHEKHRGDAARVTEVTVRFWTDEDSIFKLQPDGSYAASMYDLTRPRKGGK